jgi:hypothetical protein
MQRPWLVRTGETTFCLIGEWRSMQDITDPVSGESVLELKPTITS